MLACGAIFISDSFPELRATFGASILYATDQEDVRRHLSAILPAGRESFSSSSSSGLDLTAHSWDARLPTILDLYKTIMAARAQGRDVRRHKPKLGLLHPHVEPFFLALFRRFWSCCLCCQCLPFVMTANLFTLLSSQHYPPHPPVPRPTISPPSPPTPAYRRGDLPSPTRHWSQHLRGGLRSSHGPAGAHVPRALDQPGGLLAAVVAPSSPPPGAPNLLCCFTQCQWT